MESSQTGDQPYIPLMVSVFGRDFKYLYPFLSS